MSSQASRVWTTRARSVRVGQARSGRRTPPAARRGASGRSGSRGRTPPRPPPRGRLEQRLDAVDARRSASWGWRPTVAHTSVVAPRPRSMAAARLRGVGADGDRAASTPAASGLGRSTVGADARRRRDGSGCRSTTTAPAQAGVMRGKSGRALARPAARPGSRPTPRPRAGAGRSARPGSPMRRQISGAARAGPGWPGRRRSAAPRGRRRGRRRPPGPGSAFHGSAASRCGVGRRGPAARWPRGRRSARPRPSAAAAAA